jgi:hypothetical protein
MRLLQHQQPEGKREEKFVYLPRLRPQESGKAEVKFPHEFQQERNWNLFSKFAGPEQYFEVELCSKISQ